MDASAVTATPTCAQCGGAIEIRDEVRTDDSIVTCKECGLEIGKYSDVHAKIRKIAFQGALEAAQPAIRNFRRTIKRAGKKFR